MIKRTTMKAIKASGRVTETDIADGIGRLRTQPSAVVGYTRGGALIKLRRDLAGRVLCFVDGYEISGSDLDLTPRKEG